MLSTKRKLFALLLLLPAGIGRIASSEIDGRGMPGTADWLAYWSACRLAWAGENPYDETKLRAIERANGLGETEPTVRIWNPPWVLVVLAPLARLPFFVSAKLWLTLNLAAIFICASLIWKIAADDSVRGRITVAWASASAFVPLLITLHMGQISGLLLIGLTGFLAGAERGRFAIAGAFLSLTLIKPHVVHLVWIAAIWWMIRERRWSFAWGVGAILSFWTLALFAFAPRAIQGYRRILEDPPLFYRTPTLGGILRDLAFQKPPGFPMMFSTASGLFFLAFLMLKRPDLDWKRDLGPILLASVPSAAYGWSFDQAVLLIPYLTIVARLLSLEPRANFGRKAFGFACLAAIAGGTLAQNILGLHDLYLFWPPLALGLTFVTIMPRRPWDRKESSA